MNNAFLILQSGASVPEWIWLVGGVVVIIFLIVTLILKRIRRCPSDRILVVYGKVGGDSAKCIQGGTAFIWPIIQDYAYLDLTPMSIEVSLKSALSKQNIRVDVPSRFTIGISTEPSIMQNAASRLLGLDLAAIQELAQEIIFGQLRLVVASMDIEEINTDRDKFLANIKSNVETELKKIGLTLINVNVTDIKDESGYIEALGKEAAAKAVNDAKIMVAEKNRDGSIGEAKAVQDQRVQVSQANAQAMIGEADANRLERVQVSEATALAKIGEAEAQKDERIKISAANANAVDGENTAKIQIADSDATRREREAEANRKAEAAEKVKRAKALEEAYAAQKNAEVVRAEKERASQLADIVVPAEIEKQKITIDAEAEAEQIRAIARGQADAIFAKKEAEAKGIYEILTKQAEGLDRIVKASGDNAQDAVLLLVADKLPELVATQAEAIKNIKIDKVTVWDGGGSGGENGGKTSTANFLSGLYKSVPPLEDMFNMAGMQLPGYLKGAEKTSAADSAIETTEDTGSEDA